MKRDPEATVPNQNSQQLAPLPMPTNGDEPFKLDDWPLNLSRGPSFNNGDLNLSRLNSLNTPRLPNGSEPNFSQCKFEQCEYCSEVYDRASLYTESEKQWR
jgi:hypothetical protein